MGRRREMAHVIVGEEEEEQVVRKGKRINE